MEHKGHRNRLIRRLCCGLLLLLVAGQYVNADDKDPNDPNELLRSKWDTVVSVLQNKDIDQEEKESEISKIVKPMFNFPLMVVKLGHRCQMTTLQWITIPEPILIL